MMVSEERRAEDGTEEEERGGNKARLDWKKIKEIKTKKRLLYQTPLQPNVQPDMHNTF